VLSTKQPVTSVKFSIAMKVVAEGVTKR